MRIKGAQNRGRPRTPPCAWRGGGRRSPDGSYNPSRSCTTYSRTRRTRTSSRNENRKTALNAPQYLISCTASSTSCSLRACSSLLCRRSSSSTPCSSLSSSRLPSVAQLAMCSTCSPTPHRYKTTTHEPRCRCTTTTPHLLQLAHPQRQPLRHHRNGLHASAPCAPEACTRRGVIIYPKRRCRVARLQAMSPVPVLHPSLRRS
jgi:hypothetical protein